MKKIILLIAITLLLTACGKTETSNTSSGATVDGTASGMVQEDENAKDPDMSLT
jgi:major membrane immunogen (membrane-anchored lipoprotein)